MDQIRAVIFDLDDTLYSEKEYVKSGLSEVANILNNISDVEKKLWLSFKKGLPVIDTVLMDEGIFSQELKIKCLDAYHKHNPKIKLYDGLENTIKTLQNKKIKIGIITDGRPEGQRAKISSLGLKNLTDEIIITDELGGISYRKPNEVAFTIMKERLNVSYNEMIYIGDNPLKDFIAPLNLGINAWWFKNQDGLYIMNSYDSPKIQVFLNLEDLIICLNNLPIIY